jgi:hypothetical protein
MPEQMTVKKEHKEFLVYAIATNMWNQFVDFYDGLAVDKVGAPIEGVR